jgi:hypothetical protein
VRNPLASESTLQLGPFVKPLKQEDIANLANFKVSGRRRGYAIEVNETDHDVTVVLRLQIGGGNAA